MIKPLPSLDLCVFVMSGVGQGYPLEDLFQLHPNSNDKQRPGIVTLYLALLCNSGLCKHHYLIYAYSLTQKYFF